MSRLLKLICCAVALTAGVGVALAAAAPAQRNSHTIVCPLEPNDTITTPCCGPPIVTAAASRAFICCGTPQPINCPVGPTLTSSSNPSVAGQKITLTGRWSASTAGQTVELWQELPGAKTFSKVATTKTASLGDYQFVRKGVETNRQWYVAVGGTHSLTMAQRVKAVVTLTSGGGHVTPNHGGERVWVERETGVRWVVIARPRLTRESTYSFAGSPCGRPPLRAVFPGDRRNVRSAWNAICAPY
jgi:hypothetical protein